MAHLSIKFGTVLLAALLPAACTQWQHRLIHQVTGEHRHELMPTPAICLESTAGGPLCSIPGPGVTATPARCLAPAPTRPPAAPALNLLFVTDRKQDGANYGSERAPRIAFGKVSVHIKTDRPSLPGAPASRPDLNPGLNPDLNPDLNWEEPSRQGTVAGQIEDITWEVLRDQSQRDMRTRKVYLVLGTPQHERSFPEEPYGITVTEDQYIHRDPSKLNDHQKAEDALTELVDQLGISRTKRIVLYVHGYNESFESAAYTAAELCHFLGGEQVCAFFTWPAGLITDSPTSYAYTADSADYAVEHLKKTIHMLAKIPGVEKIELLAHSRGSAIALKAFRLLTLEAIAAGKEPRDISKIENLVLFSSDIDSSIAAQQIISPVSDPDLTTRWPTDRLPTALKGGRLTIYTYPEDWALQLSENLYSNKIRLGGSRPEQIPNLVQKFFRDLGWVNLIVYDGPRTDTYGHSYFTSNPKVSSDLIEMIRCNRTPEQRKGLEPVGQERWIWRLKGRKSQMPAGKPAVSDETFAR